jgi:HlyD family secretion protein
MFRTYVLPVISVFGIVFAMYVVAKGSKATVPAEPVATPSAAPFSAYIAGAGIVEASSENIQIGTPVAGIVTEIPVAVGSDVKKGDPLFQIDNRELQAELKVKQAALESAREQVKVEAANMADARNKWAMWVEIGDKGAVSKDELDSRRFMVQKTEAAYSKSGADVKSAEAAVGQVETEIERRIVRAPVDGQVLQIKTHLGEFAPANVVATPLVVLGNVKVLHVRTDIDENDAWRLDPKAEAVAFVRGNNQISTPLKLVRVEPYVIPKRSLTGDSTERVDTRVLQVLYKVERASVPIYVGQQMDVYVKDLVTPSSQPTTSSTLVH